MLGSAVSHWQGLSSSDSVFQRPLFLPPLAPSCGVPAPSGQPSVWELCRPCLDPIKLLFPHSAASSSKNPGLSPGSHAWAGEVRWVLPSPRCPSLQQRALAVAVTRPPAVALPLPRCISCYPQRPLDVVLHLTATETGRIFLDAGEKGRQLKLIIPLGAPSLQDG